MGSRMQEDRNHVPARLFTVDKNPWNARFIPIMPINDHKYNIIKDALKPAMDKTTQI